MSEIISNLHFIRPIALVLIPIGILLWWIWHRHLDPLRGWREQIDPDLLKALVVGGSSPTRGGAIWVLVAWIVGSVAVAGPTWRLEPSPFADDATPLMILLKADISMDRSDPEPSRLERAQLKIADLAEARKGQPLGLIAYAGSAHLVLPPTRDTAVVAQMAAEISPEIMPVPGDRLDRGLREAARVLDGGGQGGSIVVIADSVSADATELAAAKSAYPVQFLAIPDAEVLADAARALNARVEPLSVDSEDVETVIRRAARTPVAREGEQGNQWQEAGYWFVPVVALIVLVSFRRSETEEVTG